MTWGKILSESKLNEFDLCGEKKHTSVLISLLPKSFLMTGKKWWG